MSMIQKGRGASVNSRPVSFRFTPPGSRQGGSFSDCELGALLLASDAFGGVLSPRSQGEASPRSSSTLG